MPMSIHDVSFHVVKELDVRDRTGKETVNIFGPFLSYAEAHGWGMDHFKSMARFEVDDLHLPSELSSQWRG